MKSGTFTFRITEELRAKLVRAAAIRNRPVSEEIELRLEQSFLQGDLVTALREEVREEIRYALAQNLVEAVRQEMRQAVFSDRHENAVRAN